MAKKSTAAQRKKRAAFLKGDGRALPDFEKITEGHEEYKTELTAALNYAAYIFELSDKKGFVRDYAKDELNISNINKVPDWEFNHIGSIIWLLQNDCFIHNQDEYNQKIIDLVEKYDKDSKPVGVKSDSVSFRTNYIIAELEGIIDDVMLRRNDIVQPFDLLKSINGSFHVDKIKQHFKRQLDDITSFDADAEEGYIAMKEEDKLRAVGALRIIVADIDKFKTDVQPEKKATKQVIRRPRKIVPSKMVRKLKYLRKYKDEDIDIKSAPAAKIVTADVVWIYNTKTQKLAQYVAQDKAGIMCKGTTLQNFDVSKSSQKKLRKPAETLALLDKAGKVDQRKLLDDVTTKASKVNGRVNEHCVIIKIYS